MGGQPGGGPSFRGCASPGTGRWEREREAPCACPLSLNGAEIAREALGSGFDSLETFVIITVTVESKSVNP